MLMTKPTNPYVLCVRFLGQRTHRLRCSVSVVWDSNYHAFLFCMCMWHGSRACSSATSSHMRKIMFLQLFCVRETTCVLSRICCGSWVRERRARERGVFWIRACQSCVYSCCDCIFRAWSSGHMLARTCKVSAEFLGQVFPRTCQMWLTVM